MASINANLFTMSPKPQIPSTLITQCQTRFGNVGLERTEHKLRQLYFLKPAAPLAAASTGSCAAQKWLSAFSRQPTQSLWRALDPQGTEFQRRVWQALLQIPFGQCVHYSQVAEWIGQPNATRAVGSAIGANPICLLIPCHRVVPIAGGVGQYRWGADRKQRILDAETVAGATLNHFFE